MPPLRNAWIDILTDDPLPQAISSLVWANGRVTAVTTAAHGFATGDVVAVAGATPTGYNAARAAITRLDATTFTYAAAGPLTTPATMPGTVTYVADTRGGRSGRSWRTLTRIPGEYVPIGTFEQMERMAVEEGLSCRFRVRSRADLKAGQRAAWTPQWPPGVPAKVFLIKGVEIEPPAFATQLLECTEITL